MRDVREDGYDIRTVQELLGHRDVRTTVIYTHVLNRGPGAVRSPLDGLGGGASGAGTASAGGWDGAIRCGATQANARGRGAGRAKQLFGEDGAQAVAARLEQDAAVGTNPLQGMLFPDMQLSAAPAIRGRGRGRGKRAGFEVSDESLAASREATTLDRVHAAMLLQAGGRTNALRALLKAEQERGPDFLRLANAFSALYPKGSEEKRLIDAMLLAVPR